MPLLEDLAAYLDAALTSHAAGTDLFAGDMPPDPDELTALYESPGGPPIETLGPDAKPAVINPRVQVQTRAGGATAYPDSRARAYEVYNALVLITNENLSATYYLRAAPVQEPFLLHRDESERVVFAFNCDVWRVAE